MNSSNFTAGDQGSAELRIGLLPLSFYIFAHSAVALLVLVGNAVVVYTISTDRSNITPNNMFLRSLAVADFLTGLFAMPLTLYARVVISGVTCVAGYRQLFFAPAFMFCATSVGHLVTLTIDRFIAVSAPLKYASIMTKRRSKYILVIIWCLGIILGTMPVIGGLQYPNQWVCGTVNYKSGTVTIHSLLIGGFTPTVSAMLLGFYIRIFILANSHLKRTSEQRRAGMEEEIVKNLEMKARMRTTVTAVLVVLGFSICWLPMCAKMTVDAFWDESPEEVQFIYQTLVEFLGFSNSAMNPIIYTLRNSKYRKTFRSIFRVLCGIKQDADGGTTRKDCQVKVITPVMPTNLNSPE